MNNQNYKLSEVTTLIARGITPKYTDSADSISVINQKCIRDGKINFDLCRKHNHQSKRISSEKILQMNDILINSTGVGTLGRVSQIIDDLSKLITNAFGLAQNATGEIENAVKGLLDRYLADKGLVTREEDEVLKEMHSVLQNEVHSLREELNTLKPKTRSIKANTSNKNK